MIPEAEIPESGQPDQPPGDQGRSGFEELLRRAFDDELSGEEFARLQSRLRESSEERRLYLDYSALHSLLGQSFVPAGGPSFSLADDERNEPQLTPTVVCAPSDAGFSVWKTAGSRQGAGVALSLVALVTLALGIWAWRGAPLASDRAAAEQPIVAWIEGRGDAGEAIAVRVGDRVRPAGGRTAIRFQNGVQLALADVGDLEVLSGTKVHLHAGQIQVDVGAAGRGFTVLTDSTHVVDLGTVFGVQVNPVGETDVVVFEGEVELDPRDQPRGGSARAERNLNTGEAVRIQANGQRARIPMIWRDSTDLQWSTEATYRGSAVIAAVSDNLSTASRPKFYAVVPQGFREDAKVFGDRRYEWNGLSADGLPRELIGADYIRTFNDDKAQKDLEITVTLAGPADVYVLIDERYPVPDWLAADFALTDLRVGIDLGTATGNGEESVPPLGITVRRWLGVGPGKSVDVPVATWKRAVRDAGKIRLGPVPTETLPAGRGQMYGIVVARAKTNP